MAELPKLKWRIHLPSLFEEILNNPSTSILRIPLNILSNLLAEVAKRASEINDNQLNALMVRLTLYSVADPKSPDYDREIVEQVIAQAEKE
jgi:hypothetical protein